MKAHVSLSGFTIEAYPVEVGKTGLFSFFRDESGVIRFETLGRRANAASRPYYQPAFQQKP